MTKKAGEGTLKQEMARKVIVASLAFALLLSSGALYGAKSHALAEESAAQPDSSASEPSKGHWTDRLKSWFHKDGEQNSVARKETRERRQGFPIVEEAAAILGVDKAELKTQLKDKTLGEIAAAKGVSEADLIAKLQAERNKKIDEAVAAGKMTRDKADKLKALMADHLKFMVSHKLEGLKQRSGHRMHSGVLPAPEKLAAIIGISPEELKMQVQAGKSIAEIAAAKGISKEQLIAKIKEELTPWIERAVDRKKGDKPHKESAPPPPAAG